MTLDEASYVIGNLPVHGDECYDPSTYQRGKSVAIKCIDAIKSIDHDLHCMMEGDKRTMSNRETEDGLYYKGIKDAIKVFDRYTEGLEI